MDDALPILDRRAIRAGPPAPGRLIIDGPGPGAWNMGVDELLFSEADAPGMATCALRFYQWEQATLSLGYFQPACQREMHLESRDCPLVRRATGGGAIVHDRELTYSIALAAAHPLAGDVLALYRAVHESLVRVLSEWDVAAHLWDRSLGVPPAEQPFLCFERRSVGDVVLRVAKRDQKLAGSAQRRGRGAVLQHGSILLAASPAAPQLPGLAELCGLRISPEELAGRWLRELGPAIGLDVTPRPLSTQEQQEVAHWVARRYAHDEWNFRK